jgi:hypothetical protein
MTTQTVSVQVPEPIFRKLKRAADVTCRPVEEVLAATLNAALPEPSGLPPEMADELASMHLFSDDALWAATEPSLSPAEKRRLGQLNRIAGERPMTKAEKAEQEQLLAAYHRSVLRRAQALAILAQRGHPIPTEKELQAAGDDSI